MSYQVLARKWRPAKFSELVGQDHVKSAIINGLTQQRTHHAYLFTGTRGVGKTTIARIFAKSLNCEAGISAEPCGQCPVCLDVDAGRFVDLIEIDAASRTKVGDTREILDNVQYAPTRGRYKIYLIDEVHMLSRHSFNALLKTLEEPPEHVKFLFATTDPQKLPVTILSRCLQFNLQALSVKQINDQLTHILNAEHIQYQPDALTLLATYARGSMRDALSLTDQAIAQSGQNVTVDVVKQMLGTVDQSWSQKILQAVINKDQASLVALFNSLRQQLPDFSRVLDDLLTLVHQTAMCQVLPAAAKLDESNSELIKALASQASAAELQVYYQLLIQSKKELPYSPDSASVLEMACLRLFAFSPTTQTELEKKNSSVELDSPSSEQASGQNKAKEEPQEEPQEKSQEDVLEKVSAEPIAGPLSSDSVESNQHAPVSETELKEQKTSVEPKQNIDEYADYGHVMYDESDVESQYHHPVASDETSVQQDVHGNSDAGSESSEQIHAAVSPNIEFPDDAEQNPVLAILASRGLDLGSPSTSNPQASLNAEGGEPDNKAANNDVSKSEYAASASEPAKANSHQASNGESDTSHQQETMPAPDSIELQDVESESVRYAHEVDKWAAMIEHSDLQGLGRQLALNSEVNIDGDKIELIVRQEFAHLLNEKSEQELTAVVAHLAPASEFVINKSAITTAAPADIQQNINLNRQQRAEDSIQQDPLVNTLINDFGAKLIDNSIKPL